MEPIFDIPDQCKAKQAARLLAGLREFGTLNTDDAREYLAIPHVAGRVKDLRDAGHRITTRMGWARDHNGHMRRMASYVLEGACHEN